MNLTAQKLTRRQGLTLACDWGVGAAVVLSAGLPLKAWAAKADKSDFYYQDKPKDGKSCSSCRMFLPAPNGKGQCAIVAGDVLPHGWCMAYSPRT